MRTRGTETEQGAAISLPVLTAERSCGTARLGRSRMGKWRAVVLVLVHVVIGAHVIHWLVTGLTVSPVEPSESMQTLELGVVNAGFVLFSLALLSTAILGRFFCGWACHVVALQDLCGWAMRRCGIHPKPFRSRLLVLAPLGLGLYMFVWPSFKRGVLHRVVEATGLGWPAWMGGVARIESVRAEFLVEDFWSTFPSWYIAIPFLAVCGFATVYFLGSKGFCTYGCPYGGLFAPLDSLAPGRIRVNDDCEHCGHCTAVCTSNVRVHEEVRDYGMVVDPGCMKCMDCVSVCPNDALFVGLGRPAVLKKLKSQEARETAKRARASRARRYDLTRREEWVVGALWVLFFLAFRDMLDLVPMLMAAGLAGIAAYGAWKLWRLARDANVRMQNVQLKLKGAWRPAGVVFAAVAVASLLGAAWSGAVRGTRWSAGVVAARVDVPVDALFRPEFAASAEMLEAARRASGRLALTDGPSEGGYGWSLDANRLVELAFLLVTQGRFEEAEGALLRVVESGRPRDGLVFQLGQVMRARGAGEEEVLGAYESALERHEDLHGVRTVVARAWRERGRAGEATHLWESALEDGGGPAALVEAARFLAATDRERALELARRALEEASEEEDSTRLAALRLLAGLGASVDAAEAEAMDDEVGAARLLAGVGDVEGATRLLEGVGEREDASLGQLSGGAELAFALGEGGLGESLLERAVEVSRRSVWDMLGVGNLAAQLGAGAGRADLLVLAEVTLREAAEMRPGEPLLRHDLSMILMASGDMGAALVEMERAAELGEANVELARRAAQLAEQVGEAERAGRWWAEAERRGE